MRPSTKTGMLFTHRQLILNRQQFLEETRTFEHLPIMHWSTIPSLLLATAIAQVAARDFSRTCSGISYGTTTLRANCQDSRGDGTSADINLTRCLANDNGRLVVWHIHPSFRNLSNRLKAFILTEPYSVDHPGKQKSSKDVRYNSLTAGLLAPRSSFATAVSPQTVVF